LIPIGHGGSKPPSQFGQLCNLRVQRGDLVRGHFRNSWARRSAGITLFEYSCKFVKAEARFQRTADRLDAKKSIGRIDSLAPVCAKRLCQETLPFVMADRIGARAYGGSKLAGGKSSAGLPEGHSMSMNFGMRSRVNTKVPVVVVYGTWESEEAWDRAHPTEEFRTRF
jgi:hypothetical protein